MRKGNLFDSIGKEGLQRIVDESSSYREILLKCGYSHSTGALNALLKDYMKEWDIDLTNFNDASWYNGKRFVPDEVFRKDTKASKTTIIRFLKRDKNFPYECSLCGTSDWQGEKISLALTFKDGDSSNAEKDNLMWICPNCLSQRENFSKHKDKSEDK